MAGLDKGLQPYNNRPLIQHVIKRVKGQCDSVMISANRNLDRYAEFELKVVSDSQPADYQGPMAGVVACLRELTERPPNDANIKAVLICSCDAPQLPLNLADRLWRAMLSNHEHKVAVAHDGARGQALHCLIAKDAWSDLIEAFEAGERSLYRWQIKKKAIYVDYSGDADAFLNINRLEQLK